MILFFANHLGYIARSVISREEIGQLIDAGIAASDLASEIARRIDEAEVLMLGYHSFGEAQIDVKLPEQARERHVKADNLKSITNLTILDK